MPIMITIVDYGMGNLGSIRNMLSRLGVEATISSDAAAIGRADRLILPGVGAFDLAMENLEQRGLLPVLNDRVIDEKVPVLGICLGMQLFSTGSDEGTRPGLGWIDARSVRFEFPDDGVRRRLPHMGWNSIRVRQSSGILDERHEDSRYYFVHSYHVRCNDPALVLATTEYGGLEFHSAVLKGNIVGTQFHPEKSHKYGMRLLANFSRDNAGAAG
jgi:imidazole glycerol-phosphate synthase subunit HisH